MKKNHPTYYDLFEKNLLILQSLTLQCEMLGKKKYQILHRMCLQYHLLALYNIVVYMWMLVVYRVYKALNTW